jgi:hypothetical protein
MTTLAAYGPKQQVPFTESIVLLPRIFRRIELFPEQISNVHPLLSRVQLIVSSKNAEALREGVELIEVESTVRVSDLRVKPPVKGVVLRVLFPFCPLIWCDLHCAPPAPAEDIFQSGFEQKVDGSTATTSLSPRAYSLPVAPSCRRLRRRRSGRA